MLIQNVRNGAQEPSTLKVLASSSIESKSCKLEGIEIEIYPFHWKGKTKQTHKSMYKI